MADSTTAYPDCQIFSELIITIPKAIARHWLSRLSHSELAILLFVFGRTIIFRKKSEAIPYRHFEEGVFSDDKEVSCGAGIARRSIPTAVASLEEKGLLNVTRHEGKGLLASVYEINFKALLEAAMDKLHISNKRNIVVKRESDEDLQRNLLGQSGHTKVDRIKILKPKTLVSSGVADDAGHRRTHLRVSRKAALARTSRNTILPLGSEPKPRHEPATVADAVATVKDREPLPVRNIETASGIEALWKRVMLEHRPGVPVPILSAAARKKIKKVFEANLCNVDLYVFFMWAIEEWEWLRAKKLNWIAEKGFTVQVTREPSLTSIVTYAKHFALAYVDTLKSVNNTPVLLKTEAAKADDTAELKKHIEKLRNENRALTQAVTSLKKKQQSQTTMARLLRSNPVQNDSLGKWKEE